ncbi:MAG: SHOCT domain-containing protein [Duncaniella sp.]|nr:SHOCT domain-containing protein [Duncaniella sp.]
MNNIILSLRKFSLRWAIIILFIPSFIATFSSLKSGGSMLIAAIIMFLCSALFFATWCAHAIIDVKKAITILYIMLGASLINIIAQWSTINEPVDFESMITDYIFGNDTAGDYFIYTRAMSSYPTQLLGSLAAAASFIYAYPFVIKQYRFCWVCMIICYSVTFLNLFLLVMDADYLNTYSSINLVISLISFITYIILFYQGNASSDPRAENSITGVYEPISKSIQSSCTNFEDKTKQLTKLKELLDSGVLSQEEFDNEKAKILKRL